MHTQRMSVLTCMHCILGIEPHGNCVGCAARFIIETFSAGRGDIEVIVLNPKGGREPVSNSSEMDIDIK